MKSFWDWYAYFYDSIRCLLPYKDLMARTYEAVKLYKGRGIKILDAGCGTGNFARMLSEKNEFEFDYTGLDNSDAMLKRARQKNKGAEFKNMDLAELGSYQSEKYSHIVCLNALYAQKDPKMILKQFYDKLKFGGLLIIANPVKDPKIIDILKDHFLSLINLNSRNNIFQEIVKTIINLPLLFAVLMINLLIKRKAQIFEFKFMNEDELERLVQKAGFSLLRTETAYGNTNIFLVAVKALCDDDFTAEVVYRADDMDEIFKLRYNVYCEELKSLNENYLKKESDQYDDFSIHFVLKHHNEIICYLRLILDNESLGFLMEHEFHIPKAYDRRAMGEISRLILKQKWRNGKIFFDLVDIVKIWCKENGIFYLCAAAQTFFIKKITARKYNFKIIGKTKSYHNYEVVPLVITLCR